MSVGTSRPGLRWAVALYGCGLALTLAAPAPALGQPFGGRGGRMSFRPPTPMMGHPMMGHPMMATPHPMTPGAQALHVTPGARAIPMTPRNQALRMTPRMATSTLARTPRLAINQRALQRDNLITRRSIARQSLAARRATLPRFPLSAAYGRRAVNPYAFSSGPAASGVSAPSSGYSGGSGGSGGYSGGSGGSDNYGMNPYGSGPYGPNSYGPDLYGYNAYLLSLSQGPSAVPAGQTSQPGQPASTSGQGSKTAP
jgi:hypothetical protein